MLTDRDVFRASTATQTRTRSHPVRVPGQGKGFRSSVPGSGDGRFGDFPGKYSVTGGSRFFSDHVAASADVLMCGGPSSQGMTGKTPVPPQNLCSPQGAVYIPAVILVGQASRLSIYALDFFFKHARSVGGKILAPSDRSLVFQIPQSLRFYGNRIHGAQCQGRARGFDGKGRGR